MSVAVAVDDQLDVLDTKTVVLPHQALLRDTSPQLHANAWNGSIVLSTSHDQSL